MPFFHADDGRELTPPEVNEFWIAYHEGEDPATHAIRVDMLPWQRALNPTVWPRPCCRNACGGLTSKRPIW